MRSITVVDDELLATLREEMTQRQTTELFVLFGLGSQYDHKIYMALAAQGVYCVTADPGAVTASDVARLNPKGIVLSGGPVSVGIDPPPFDAAIFDLGIPVLGICLGFQLWAQHFGAAVHPAEHAEYGEHRLELLRDDSSLLKDLPQQSSVVQSHREVVEIPAGPGWQVWARTDNCEAAAASYRHCHGVQFHPEVSHTEYGAQIFANFCFEICGARDVFPAASMAQELIEECRQTIGPGQTALLCLSGGSDSAVASEILERAIPGQTYALYIKAVDRPDDEATVRQYWGERYGDKLLVVDATERFLEALAGLTTFPAKRDAVRRVYKVVVEEIAEQIGASFIVQGTLYTDITESGHGLGSAAKKATIKKHHNVALGFTLPEYLPLARCHKDSARQIGRELGMPEAILVRHPFPGPGLVVRVEPEITADSLRMARQLDGIYIEELRRAELYEAVWQAGANITDAMHTFTKGDGNGIGYIIMLWAVNSVDGYTDRWSELPNEFWRRVSGRITNEVEGVGTVTMRISDKPPSTVEAG